ncbi:nitrate/nitrite transporter NrtS [Tumidithrix helvetica]|uniref:nitrate/nitrite transporter NrtS n=1 Tax=Tumidithrix helvetica TaxID=3457545 RepID=UPI003CC5D5ED
MNTLKAFYHKFTDPEMRPTALKVAFIVGSVLFALNHGVSLLQGEMTTERWISAALTYLVPYTVSMHGQASARLRLSEDLTQNK